MSSVPALDYLRRAQDLHKRGQFGGAEHAYASLLATQPEHAAGWHYLGVLYSQSGRAPDALGLINRSIDLDRNSTAYLLNRALVHERNGSKALARSDFIAALNLDSSLQEAYLGLADLSREAFEYREASIHYSKALALAPSCPKTWMNLGAAYDSEKRFPEALQCYRIAANAEPGWPDPVLNAALCNLLQGNFEKGWEQYEARWHVKSLLDAADMSKPLTTSRPAFSREVSSGIVLLWAEQGLGDEIMFGSLINDFSCAGNDIIVQCDKRLRSLFERSMPKIRFVNRTTEVPESDYDYHLPIGSLPRLLRPSIDSFANHKGTYLSADPQRISSVRECGPSNDRVRIGLSWGSARGEARCVPLHQLLASIASPKAEFVSLQYGEVRDHIERAERLSGIRVLEVPDIDVTNDLDGLAALIESCDLVVTVGNATAHLAGALGKPGLVLLPYHPGWRWLASGESSPWYPSLRLLRQATRAEWSPVLNQLRDLIPIIIENGGLLSRKSSTITE
jgi:tetratricopeptide (TPR) repeat protein